MEPKIALENLLRTLLPERLKALVREGLFKAKSFRFKPYIQPIEVDDLTFQLSIGDPTAKLWYPGKRHALSPELSFIKHNLAEPGDVVFECGAHQGFTTLLLAKWVGPSGRVIAFEPFPGNTEMFEKNIVLNGVSNIVLHNKAVGAANGETFLVAESNSRVSRSKTGLSVGMVALDDYKHLRPNLIKIDVEGLEVDVLRGAREILLTTPKLAIEIHTRSMKNFNASTADLFGLINRDSYDFWVQWDAREQPCSYDFSKPITERAHLFAKPKKREDAARRRPTA